VEKGGQYREVNDATAQDGVDVVGKVIVEIMETE
jgi:hypothetical protein